MDDTPLSDSDDVSIAEEPDYRYGPQVRLVKNHRDEAKIEAVNLDEKILKVYQHTPKWALQAVHNAGYDTVYLHDESCHIESYDELMDAVREVYGSD